MDEIARQRKEHQPKKDERQAELFPGGDPKYTIEALRDRLRELDEKNQTQAHCLAARAEKIDRMEAELSVRRSSMEWLEKQIAVRSAKCETCFDNYAKATGKLAERAEAAEAEVRRLNRMVDRACELYADLQGSCPCDAHDFEPDGDCNETCKNEYAACWRKYLESEVADKWLK